MISIYSKKKKKITLFNSSRTIPAFSILEYTPNLRFVNMNTLIRGDEKTRSGCVKMEKLY